MLIRLIEQATQAFFWSSSIFIFFVVKGGFNKKYLYTDNVLVTVFSTLAVWIVNRQIGLPDAFRFVILAPALTGLLFVMLFFYRFYRNPKRDVVINPSNVLSPADGRIIYIKELEPGMLPVSIKKRNMMKIDEITKTDMLKTPCYLIGIAMTLFDVHYNRAPVMGSVELVKHTDGLALGLRNPDSTFVNERNTIVFKDHKNRLFGVIQIAAKGVRRCIATINVGDQVEQGQIIGKIRFGSQVDLILPRSYSIHVREGDQVYAGKSILAYE